MADPLKDEEIRSRVRNIQENVTHGATALAEHAAQVLAFAARRSTAATADGVFEDFEEVARVLLPSRPSMSAVTNSVVRLVMTVAKHRHDYTDAHAFKDFIAAAAARLVEAEEDAKHAVAAHIRNLLKPGSTVITLSYSDTVIETLAPLASRGLRVYVGEGRPLCEGRDSARTLADAGVDVTLVTDAAMGHYAGCATLALVGGDTVQRDGSLINKSGTYLLALAAHDRGVPFYAACQTLKFQLGPANTRLEEKDVEQLGEPIPGVVGKSLLFDLTPARLVTRIVTENGLIKPAEVEPSLAKWCETFEALTIDE